ncbi:Zn-finger in Ran binding protein [Trichinella nativa]|uniref:Zn-finger in Ran binding protein n=1 Tax=Trichinella nativa TaxID=6335 RepID=A0A1Y3E9T9_9BILA|nr:Zn-finger in Ran binding protein [Trichinella nativa]
MLISKELSSQSEDISTLSSDASINLEQRPVRAEKVQSQLPKHETQTVERLNFSHGLKIDRSRLCGFQIDQISEICERNLSQAVRDGATLTHFYFSRPDVLVVPGGLFPTKKLEKRRSDLVNRATWRCMTCNGRNIDALSYCNLCMFPRSSETVLPKSTALNTEKSNVGNLSSEKHGVQGELNLKMPNDNMRSGGTSSNSFTKKFKPSEKCIICGLLLDFGSSRKCPSCEKFNFYEPITDVRRNVMRTTKSFDSTIRKRWWNRRRFASEQTSILNGWTCKGCLFLNKPISQICFRCGCSSDSVEGGISSSAWKCPACFVSNDDTNSKRCVNCLALRPSKFSLKNEKSWRCTGCCVLNSGNFDNCLQCRMPRSILKENTSDVSSSNSQSLTVSHDETAGDVQKFPDESSSTKSDLPKWYCTICFLGNAAEQFFCSSCNAPKPGSGFKSISINFATTTEDESTDVAENGKAVVDDSSTSVGIREGSGDSNTSAVHFKAPDLSPPPSPPEPKATSTLPSVRLGIESEPVFSKKTAKRSLFSASDELTTTAPSFTFNFGQQKASTVAVTSSEDTKISSATVSPTDVIANAFKVAETDLSSLSFPVFQFGASIGDPNQSKSSSTTPVSSENVLASQTSSASGGIFTFGTAFSSKTPISSTQSIATNSRLSLPCLTTTASTTKTASFPTFSFPTPTSVPFAFNFGSSKSDASVTATTTTTPAGAAAANIQFRISICTFGSNIAASMAPTFNFSTAPPSVVGAGVGTSVQPQIG